MRHVANSFAQKLNFLNKDCLILLLFFSDSLNFIFFVPCS